MDVILFMKKYCLLLFTFTIMIFLYSCNTKNEKAMMVEEVQIPIVSSSSGKVGISDVVNEHGNLEDENLILVNDRNPMPKDFVPTLVDIGNGYKFDEKGAKYLLEMIEAARQDGINLFVVSSYRSVEKQTKNFNNSIEQLKSEGYTEQEAYNQTIRYIALPGTSEHSLGLAVDLNSLEESFEQTAEFNWLKKNCYKYGFILRYPKNKESVTKIAYEPWHYRYVGKKHAEKIMMDDITLEEYLLKN